MKTKMNTYLLTFALLGSAFMFNSCEKGDDTGNTGGVTPPKTNSVSAQIGSKILEPSGLPLVNFESGTGTLDFTVYDKDQVHTLAIYLDVNGGNGQSFASGGTAFANVQTSSTTEGLYTSDGGSLTLTTNDKTNRIVEGTFSFSAKNINSPPDNINVSGGKFYIKY